MKGDIRGQRIAEEVADMIFYAMSRGLDTDKQNQEASELSAETSDSILSFIEQEFGTVKCDRCKGTGYSKWKNAEMSGYGEEPCPDCQGTGVRELVVRVIVNKCSECGGARRIYLTYSDQMDGRLSDCPLCNPMKLEDTTTHCPICEANSKAYEGLVEAAGKWDKFHSALELNKTRKVPLSDASIFEFHTELQKAENDLKAEFEKVRKSG